MENFQDVSDDSYHASGNYFSTDHYIKSLGFCLAKFHNIFIF